VLHHFLRKYEAGKFSATLAVPQAELIVRKGYRRNVDSYSAFREADRVTPTGLAEYLHERGFIRVFLAGLATYFCVAWSAVDARQAGFDVCVIEDACRAINTGGSLADAWSLMQEHGVVRLGSKEVMSVSLRRVPLVRWLLHGSLDSRWQIVGRRS